MTRTRCKDTRIICKVIRIRQFHFGWSQGQVEEMWRVIEICKMFDF